MIVYPLASLMNLFRAEGKIRRGMITILEGKSVFLEFCAENETPTSTRSEAAHGEESGAMNFLCLL